MLTRNEMQLTWSVRAITVFFRIGSNSHARHRQFTFSAGLGLIVGHLMPNLSLVAPNSLGMFSVLLNVNVVMNSRIVVLVFRVYYQSVDKSCSFLPPGNIQTDHWQLIVDNATLSRSFFLTKPYACR